MPKRDLTEEQIEAARHVLGYYGAEGGWQAGSFTQNILRAYQGADPGNKARLRRGFPEIAEAMDLVDNHPNGIEKLQLRLKP